jgi:aminoethylphosphonate catabolism LysR family transcriptional regulator
MLYTRLRSFHAVAREGGFTAAARALGIGQPTVTSQVKALEDHFQVELFHRQGRRVRPTDTGKALFAVTQRLMAAEVEAQDMLNAVGGFHSGELKVAAVGPYHVTEMLSAFSERYPDIKLSVTVRNSQESLQWLLDYRADVGVLAQMEPDPRFHAIPYSRHPVVVFVNTDHPWAGRAALRLRDLEGQRMVLRELGSTTRRALEETLAREGVAINPVMEIGSREAVWMAVERGIGIGVVSEIEFVPHPRLRVLKVADAELYTYAHVVCLAERRESRIIRAFLDVVDVLLATRAATDGRRLTSAG